MGMYIEGIDVPKTNDIRILVRPDGFVKQEFEANPHVNGYDAPHTGKAVAIDAVAPAHAKWEAHEESDQRGGDVFVRWLCNNCGYVRACGWKKNDDVRKPTAKFCECCGAKMG